MSLETLQTFVGLRDIGRLVNRDTCQQITPDINFTCDGVITKWIVGGFWVSDSSLIPGPELQLWRKTTSNTLKSMAHLLLLVSAVIMGFIMTTVFPQFPSKQETFWEYLCHA